MKSSLLVVVSEDVDVIVGVGFGGATVAVDDDEVDEVDGS